MTGAISATAVALGASAATGASIAAGVGTFGTVASVAGAGLTAVSTISQMNNEKNQANNTQNIENYNAQVAEQNANTANANASSKASVENTNTQYQLSKARAAAAGAGGDPDSASTVNVEEQIAGRGEYNQLSDIYTGATQAASYKNQAALDTYTGQQAQAAVGPEQLSTLANGATTLFTKYGFTGGAGGQGGVNMQSDNGITNGFAPGYSLDNLAP